MSQTEECRILWHSGETDSQYSGRNIVSTNSWVETRLVYHKSGVHRDGFFLQGGYGHARKREPFARKTARRNTATADGQLRGLTRGKRMQTDDTLSHVTWTLYTVLCTEYHYGRYDQSSATCFFVIDIYLYICVPLTIGTTEIDNTFTFMQWSHRGPWIGAHNVRSALLVYVYVCTWH